MCHAYVEPTGLIKSYQAYSPKSQRVKRKELCIKGRKPMYRKEKKSCANTESNQGFTKVNAIRTW